MSLMSNLFVGQSGLQTSHNALNTTAHNLANVDTKGYTRQQVSQGTRAYQTLEVKNNGIGPKQVGTGVSYNDCKQVRNEFLDSSYRREQGRLAFYDVSKKALEEIQDQFQELNGTQFSQSMDNLWEAVQELAKDPTNATTQGLLITRADEFVTRAKSVYEGLKDYQKNLDSTVSDMVKRINNIGDNILNLNKEIVKIEAGKVEKANDLRDVRNKLIDELGTYGKIDYMEDNFGNVQLMFEGSYFITSDHVNHMNVDTKLSSSVGFATPYWEYAAKSHMDDNGNKMIDSIDGANVFDLTQNISTSTNTDIGKLKSTLLARGDHYGNYHDMIGDNDYYSKNISGSVIMNVQAEFDQMVHNIEMAINEIFIQAQSNPAVLNGMNNNSDYVLFTISNESDKLIYDVPDGKKGTVLTGLTIENSQVNPKLIAEPTMFTFKCIDGSEDIDTMEKLKKAFMDADYSLNPSLLSKESFTTYYNSLISQIANSGDVVNSITISQEYTVGAVNSAREQVVGVSSDEELGYMIQFQNAYNANSRYINTVSEMLEHLVTSLGN